MEARYFLVFEGGTRQGEKIAVPAGTFRIGRKPDNNLVLTQDNKISGHHAQILISENGIYLKDLDSTNGTLLDGKKIEEAPLSHDDRITVGETFFRFLDSQAESSQEIHHIQLHQKQAKKLPVLPVLLVLLLAGAGYFYFSEPGAQTSKSSPVIAVAGNLVRGFSFEGPEAESSNKDWNLQDGGSESFSINGVEKRSGESALTAQFGEAGFAVASAAQSVRAEPSQKYRLAAWVAGKGENLSATVRVHFRSSSNPDLEIVRGLSWNKVDAASGFERIEGELDSPPGLDQATISCVAAGGKGRVSFDDLELVKLGPIGTPSLSLGDSVFDFNPRGGFIHKIDSYLMHGIGFSFNPLEESQVFEQIRVQTEKKENGIQASFSFGSRSSGAEGIFHFRVPAQVVGEHGVTVLGEKQNASYSSDFRENAVLSLVVGDEVNRVRVRFAKPSPVTAKFNAQGFVFEIPASAAQQLFFQLSFDEEKRKGSELLLDAQKKEEQSRVGEALALYAKLLTEFPFDKRTVAKARERYDEIFRRGMEKITEIERRSEEARFFALRKAFQEVRKTTQALAKSYAQTEIGARAELILAKLDADLRSVEIELDREESMRLRSVASALEAMGSKRLSQEILRYLNAHYTESGAEEKKP